MTGLPQKIGKYRIESVLGKGAMGLVYQAVDPLLDRHVALKVITGEDVTDEMKERFHIEARAAARLDHPNIVVIFDMGEEQGTPYIAMEILKGEDLRAYVRKRPDLAVDEACDIVAQVCEGLAYAHERHVVHRDIKPANIHRCPDGRIKIVDFGVAKVDSTSLTKTGMVIGTPDYMSPEQIQGKAVDARSDIFSVGVVFYELLARDKPFTAESITSVIYNIVFKQPTSFAELNREVPAEVERIVRKAMAKDLADRYQRISDMAADIRRYLASRGRGVMPPPSTDATGAEATRVLTPEEVTSVQKAHRPAGTVQVAESPAQRQGAASGEAGGTVAMGSQGRVAEPAAPVAPPAKSKLPLVLGAAAALVVVVVVAVLLTRGSGETPAPVPGTGAPGPATAVPVELVVLPWARVDRLAPASGGDAVTLEQPVTPLRVVLPPGRYVAEVSNPELGLKGRFEISVQGAGPVRATHVLEGFDPAAAVAGMSR